VSESTLNAVRSLLARCTEAEREAVFRELLGQHSIHPYEAMVGAPAEMILEAVHRGSDLTRRMIRGVIADAAFGLLVVPTLSKAGWTDVTPAGNFAYDYKLQGNSGDATVQVKLQRSKLGQPVLTRGRYYGFNSDVYLVETQKTRTGTRQEEKTRPYRYGEFDILAVSLQPSTGDWSSFA
jgi:hypothetical protein